MVKPSHDLPATFNSQYASFGSLLQGASLKCVNQADGHYTKSTLSLPSTVRSSLRIRLGKASASPTDALLRVLHPPSIEGQAEVGERPAGEGPIEVSHFIICPIIDASDVKQSRCQLKCYDMTTILFSLIRPGLHQEIEKAKICCQSHRCHLIHVVKSY